MNPLRQIIAVTILGLTTLHTRLKPSLMVVASLALVVMVMQFFLSAHEGIRHTYVDAGDPGRAIVTAIGAQNMRRSSLSREAAALIQAAPGIARASDGSPLAEAEVTTSIHLMKRNGADGYTMLEGVGPKGLTLRPELKILAGRPPTPGRRELMAGEAAQEKFAGADVGGTIHLPDGAWPVVGVYSAGGGFAAGDLMGDVNVVMPALRRNQYNFVLARLVSPSSFDGLARALGANPALQVTAERDSDYWQRQYDELPIHIIATALVYGSLIGLGAFAGIVQVMYSAVAARENEIAILRAIGFGGFAVAASVVLEAMLLALAGSAIGTAVIAHWWSGFAYNGAYGVFHIQLTPIAYLLSASWVLAIALMGALSPAIKASRVTVVEALRAC
jgi:putative ABC transport system permease protein